jgi:hypothetical protein
MKARHSGSANRTINKNSAHIENRKGARTVMDDVLEDADRANRKRHNIFTSERYAYLSQSHVREDRIFEAREVKTVSRQYNDWPSRRS